MPMCRSTPLCGQALPAYHFDGSLGGCEAPPGHPGPHAEILDADVEKLPDGRATNRWVLWTDPDAPGEPVVLADCPVDQSDLCLLYEGHLGDHAHGP